MKKARLSISTRLLGSFLVVCLILLITNLVFFRHINNVLARLDTVYEGNVRIQDMTNDLRAAQDSLYLYLGTRSSDALETYYGAAADYKSKLSGFSSGLHTAEQQRLRERISALSEEVFATTDEAISYKRARDTAAYRFSWTESERISNYLYSELDRLNNTLFVSNAANYQALEQVLQRMQSGIMLILVLVTALSVALLLMITRSMTGPLRTLVDTSKRVAAGDYEVMVPASEVEDEISQVGDAFNQMTVSIRQSMADIRTQSEAQARLRENQALMSERLKDAQLRYLQAQINPHFLFNSLNAGVQLAMLEDAERTGDYLQNLSDFFRYNVRAAGRDSDLAGEISLVDNYVHIMNVRYGGDVDFGKEVDESLLHTRLPSMVLQPLVENAMNYGVRGIAWHPEIHLTVSRAEDSVLIEVSDNGVGMSPEQIAHVLEPVSSDELEAAEEELAAAETGKRQLEAASPEERGLLLRNLRQESTGVGLRNVISRLNLYYERSDILSISSPGLNRGTTISLHLPQQGAST